MDVAIITAIIAALAGVGSAIATSVSNRNSVRDTNATNASNIAQTNATNVRLAGEANEWSSAEWQRQFDATNEYNLFTNQIQRLRDANLNPALAYGGGLVDATTAEKGSTPTAHLASAQPFQAIAPMLENMLSGNEVAGIADAFVKRAQVENLDANTQEVMSRIPENEQAVVNLRQQVEHLKSQVDVNQQMVKNMKADRLKTNIETALAAQLGALQAIYQSGQNELLGKTLDNYQKQFDTTIENLEASTREMLSNSQMRGEIAKQIALEVKKGNIELREKYGATEQEIDATIKKHYLQLQRDIETERIKSKGDQRMARFQSSAAYERMVRVQMFMETYLAPLKWVAGAAGSMGSAAILAK